MECVIGADHRGFLLKEALKKTILEVKWIDLGTNSQLRIDYPLIAHRAAQMICQKQVMCGVLICGSGIGMTIVANRYRSVRAALVWNSVVGIHAKEHDNANTIVFPADYISTVDAISSFYAWHNAIFLGGIYEKRVKEIDQLLM